LRDLYLLIAITVLCHSSAAGVRVALSLYALDLGATALSVGLIMGIYGVLPMFFSVAAGRLSDRIGAQRPMLYGSAAIAAGAAIPFVWPSMAALYAGSCLVGSGFMFYNIAMQNVAGHIGRPEDRATNLSLISLGFSFSTMIGPSLAGFSIDAAGHRNTFLVFALLPLLPVAVLALRKLAVPAAPRQRTQGAQAPVLDLLRDRTLLRIFITSGMLSISWELYTFVLPVYGSSVGLSPTAIGLVMASFSAAILAIRVALPFFIKRVGTLQVISATLVYSAALYALFPFSASAWVLAGLSFLLGLAMGIPQPLIILLLHNTVPPGRAGEAIGLRQSTIYASQAFMPMVFGAVGSAFGLGPVFWASALCFAAAGWYGRPRSRR
jgi:predicted MFS family arabinose efflux permease